MHDKILRYNGEGVINVDGFGSFKNGDEKKVSAAVAICFQDKQSKARGWEVRNVPAFGTSTAKKQEPETLKKRKETK